jgi:hypothetical protein
MNRRNFLGIAGGSIVVAGTGDSIFGIHGPRLETIPIA